MAPGLGVGPYATRGWQPMCARKVQDTQAVRVQPGTILYQERVSATRGDSCQGRIQRLRCGVNTVQAYPECLGFRRDSIPPRQMASEWNAGEEVHLGAGLWDRGNVIIGIYDMWHGEGNSDAHVKAGLVGSSQAIPLEKGKLMLGTWQAIYLCEFDGPRSRKVHVQVLES